LINHKAGAPSSTRFMLMALVFVCSQAWANPYNQNLLDSPSCRFAADFSQQRAFPDGINFIRASGQIYFDCRHGLIWSVEKPISSAQIFLLDGDMYDVDFTAKVSPIDGPIQRRIGSVLSALLSGNQKQLNADFRLDTDPASGIRLTPKQAVVKRALLGISIEGGDHPLDRLIKIVQADDQVITIETTNVTIGDEERGGASSCIALLGQSSNVACSLLSQQSLISEDL
jgi:hypothetical protein